MKATSTTDRAVQELQDEARARSGRRVGDRWRMLEGLDDGLDALLVQRFTGGRVWKTIFAFRSDGSFRAVP